MYYTCALYFYLCCVTSAVLVSTPSTTEGNPTNPEKPIRHSHSLCAGEKEFIQERKQVVTDALNELGINCEKDEVPHIALLGSGGGQRAALSLLGSLYQMAQEGLLDSMLYLGGVSGSTWTMASVYSDPNWSTNMNQTVASLLSGNLEIEKIVYWLVEKAQREDFSLTELWGLVTAVGIMKQWDTRKFSDEAARNATNPYPIYNAIEKYSLNNGPIGAKWFEMSPHEEGFTELGLFVETSLLGSKFEGGALIAKEPELDMIQLQGIMGCTWANKVQMEKYIPAWLNEPGRQKSAEEEEYLHHYNSINHFLNLTKQHITDPAAVAHIEDLQKKLNDRVSSHGSLVPKFDENSEDIIGQFQQWVRELLATIEDWAHALMDKYVGEEISELIVKIIPLLLKWEWGTTKNFLYNYKEVPLLVHLHSEQNIHLIDAGLFINVPYAPFLGEKRDMDLIIVQESSAGETFESLISARNYAAEVNKPFPELDDKVLEADRDWPKACYVFDGKDKAPTIVYMPIFNQQNCKDAEEWKQKMETYATIQASYTSEMVTYLLETAKGNVSNNKETLLQEINKALQRRKNKMAK